MQVQATEASLTSRHPCPRSPISSLPTLFDQTVSCSSSGQLENVPQATPNIEQLLEKQGNGEAGVNSESLGAWAAGGEVLLHVCVGARSEFAHRRRSRVGDKAQSVPWGSIWQRGCELGAVSSLGVV